MIRPLTPFIAAVAFLAGCASTLPPRFSTDHPASPDAQEGARLPRQSSLRADDSTRKSHTLLSAAQKEQEQWDAHGPVSGTPEDAPKSDPKPEMNHDQH